MHAMARAAMERHPAEPYLPFIVGFRADHERDDDPMPWLGATLERARVYATAHMVLAHVVGRRSPSQARLEYRIAAQQAPELLERVSLDGVKFVHGYYDAMELVPSGTGAEQMLEFLGRGLDARLPATRVRLDAELLSHAPGAPGPVLRAASDAVDDLEAGDETTWCRGPFRDGCVQRALTLASRAAAIAPRACEPQTLRARARAAAGEAQAGLAELTCCDQRQ